MIYSIEPREYLLKAMAFCLLLKNNGKNRGENESKTFNCKYSQKCLESAKISGADAFKTSS